MRMREISWNSEVSIISGDGCEYKISQESSGKYSLFKLENDRLAFQGIARKLYYGEDADNKMLVLWGYRTCLSNGNFQSHYTDIKIIAFDKRPSIELSFLNMLSAMQTLRI